MLENVTMRWLYPATMVNPALRPMQNVPWLTGTESMYGCVIPVGKLRLGRGGF